GGAGGGGLGGGREREGGVPVLDHLGLLELLAELLQVDAGVDHAAVLEVLHPAQRLLDVAARLEHELQEELDELLHREELAEQVDGVVGVAVAHGPGPARSYAFRTAARHARADSASSVRSLVVKTWKPSAAKSAIWSVRRRMIPAPLPASFAAAPTRWTAAR